MYAVIVPAACPDMVFDFEAAVWSAVKDTLPSVLQHGLAVYYE